jgi:mono/diheme cytochrome c family protein
VIRASALFCASVAWLGAYLGAAPPPQAPPQPPQFDQSAVERGGELLASQCGFCHGTNARGGSGGPDLSRSALVQSDEGGRQLGEFLRVGRPDRGMPKFELSDAQISDLATFLHSAIHFASNRRLYKILDIVTGDPKAGEAFFNGAGKCSTCHSPARDLKGIGLRYEPAVIQGRFLLPRGGRSGGRCSSSFAASSAVEITSAACSLSAAACSLAAFSPDGTRPYSPTLRKGAVSLRETEPGEHAARDEAPHGPPHLCNAFHDIGSKHRVARSRRGTWTGQTFNPIDGWIRRHLFCGLLIQSTYPKAAAT